MGFQPKSFIVMTIQRKRIITLTLMVRLSFSGLIRAHPYLKILMDSMTAVTILLMKKTTTMILAGVS